MFDEETLESVTMEILQDLRYECINGYEMKRTDFFLKLYFQLAAIEYIPAVSRKARTRTPFIDTSLPAKS